MARSFFECALTNRSEQLNCLRSLRSGDRAEFQEREIFDLYGIVFEGHPDLRPLLMWDEFKDHPMRHDYVEPDDYEYEPTPHDEVLERAQAHKAAVAAGRRSRTFLDIKLGKGQRVGIAHLSSEPDGEGELLEVAMGPQHPSTHGVFRMDVALDGERVVKLKPVFGYLHRNHEKIAEDVTYLGSMPYTDRLDYFCSLTNNLAYALAVEKLAGSGAGARRISSA